MFYFILITGGNGDYIHVPADVGKQMAVTTKNTPFELLSNVYIHTYTVFFGGVPCTKDPLSDVVNLL